MNKMSLEIFTAGIGYVQGNAQKLRTEYGENYIAVLGEQGVIDSDKDQSALVRRVAGKGKRGLLVTTISDITDPHTID